MTNHLLSMTRMCVLSLAIAGFPGLSQANEEPAPPIANTSGPVRGLSVVRDPGSKEYRVLWPGHRMLRGTVESVVAGVVKVRTGELVSRFLSAKEALEKGMALPALINRVRGSMSRKYHASSL